MNSQVHIARNVSITDDLVRNIHFHNQETGDAFISAKARGLPELVIRRVNAGEVIGHLRGHREEPTVTATTERQVFLKMVEEVWAKMV